MNLFLIPVLCLLVSMAAIAIVATSGGNSAADN